MAATPVDAIHDSDAERAVLGALLLDRTALQQVVGWLETDDFYVERHRLIYRACLHLHEQGKAADLVTVTDHLRQHGVLERVGGASYLATMVDGLPDVANVVHYAEIVIRCAVEREITVRASDLARRPGDPAAAEAMRKALREPTATEAKPRLWTAPSSAAVICTAEYPEPRWIVDRLYPEGLTLLCGRPKVGKSWQCLALAMAVAGGGEAFGSVAVEAGNVLYLALEDPLRRLKWRIGQLLASGETVPAGLDVLPIGSKLPPLGEGLEEYLAQWIDGRENPRLVLVDTLGRVRPRSAARRSDWYLEDTHALTGLHQLANDRHVGIIAVGHLRKAGADDPVDTVSGSVGLTGVADTVAVLTRARNDDNADLFVTGRDVEERTFALVRRGALWTIIGTAEEARISETRRKILDVLTGAGGGLHYRRLAEITGLTIDNTKKTLERMVRDGQVNADGDGYYRSKGVTAVTASPLSPRDPVSPRLKVVENKDGDSSDSRDTSDKGDISDRACHEDKQPGRNVGNVLPEHVAEWPPLAKRRLRELRAGSWQKDAAIARVREMYGGVTCSRGEGPLDRPTCDKGSSDR